MSRQLHARFLLLLLTTIVPTPSLGECQKTVVYHENPGGEAIPGLIVECDEPAQSRGLGLQQCDHLAPSHREACVQAFERAAAARAKAKARAALRRGDSVADVADHYTLTEGEVEALRASALASRGVAASEAQEGGAE